MHAALRERVRVRMERDPQPSAAIADSRSIDTTGMGGKERGYDGAKKVKGRKRRLLVDTQGLVLVAKVHVRLGAKMSRNTHALTFPANAQLTLGLYDGAHKPEKLSSPTQTEGPLPERKWDKD